MSIARIVHALAREPWTAAKGAAKYVDAALSGDFADDATTAQRRAACKVCPSRVRITVEGATAPSDWCGEPFVDRTNTPDKPTCGCLLAGKTRVASQRCPQGRW